MPFIPHTAAEEQAMLAAIGVASKDELFDEIPAALKHGNLADIASGLSEMDMLALMGERADRDPATVCFMGAGAYDHHIPAAVWDLTSRGEFMTAYTPYQAEASQGTLQLIYEYQTMMANLTGLEVSNASVYDGASGLAEAVLMAVRANKKARSRRVLLPASVPPLYARAARNICRHQGIEFVDVPLGADGRLDPAQLGDDHADAAALIVPQPNFFGMLEDVDGLTDWAAARQMLTIGVVNPLSLLLLKPPGEWGATGAHIACGDGQPMGIPMASGGPSFGFICCTQKLVRQLPGRLIGRTRDLEDRVGFTLTLQAREQHIRRGKATSNICTNQGLLVTAGTIHMSIMGADGLTRVAEHCVANTRRLVAKLTRVPGVRERFDGAYFHERVLHLPKPAVEVRDALLQRGILAGLPLAEFYPDRTQELLVCATEKRTAAELDAYAQALAEVLAA